MLVKSEGIVLNRFNYSDNSIIVKIFTRNYGLQTFIVKGAFRKKSSQKASIYQPLSILEIVFYNYENKEIKIPKETRISQTYQTLQSNYLKSSIALFLAEILSKVIRETFPDERKYEFIKNSLLHFDLQDEGIVNFHLSFLLKLCNYLGFSLTNHEIDNFYIDFQKKLTEINPYQLHISFNKNQFQNLLQQGYTNLSEIKINNLERRTLLDTILNYYERHIENLGNIKSLDILQQVFD